MKKILVVPGGLIVLKATQKMLQRDLKPSTSLFSISRCYPCTTKSVLKAEKWLVETMMTYGWSEKQTKRFRLAVSEALENAVLYVCPRRRQPNLRITALFAGTKYLYVAVQDSGTPIHLAVLRDNLSKATDTVNLRQHGRGLYIMCAAADLVAINPCASGTPKEFILGLARKAR